MVKTQIIRCATTNTELVGEKFRFSFSAHSRLLFQFVLYICIRHISSPFTSYALD